MEPEAKGDVWKKTRHLSEILHEKGQNMPLGLSSSLELLDRVDLLESRGDKGKKIDGLISKISTEMPDVAAGGDSDLALSKLHLVGFLLKKRHEDEIDFWWEQLSNSDFDILVERTNLNQIPKCLFSKDEDKRYRQDSQKLSLDEFVKIKSEGGKPWKSAFVSMINELDHQPDMDLGKVFDQLQNKFPQG